MSGEGFPDVVAVAVPESEALVNPLQAGAEWLRENGVGYHVAGIRLIGPNPACNGTLAEMVGTPGHSPMKDAVERMITDAVAAEQDPEEAVASGLSLFAQRDEAGVILRVSEDELKKN